jgi:hypothetical protein
VPSACPERWPLAVANGVLRGWTSNVQTHTGRAVGRTSKLGMQAPERPPKVPEQLSTTPGQSGIHEGNVRGCELPMAISERFNERSGFHDVCEERGVCCRQMPLPLGSFDVSCLGQPIPGP